MDSPHPYRIDPNFVPQHHFLAGDPKGYWASTKSKETSALKLNLLELELHPRLWNKSRGQKKKLFGVDPPALPPGFQTGAYSRGDLKRRFSSRTSIPTSVFAASSRLLRAQPYRSAPSCIEQRYRPIRVQKANPQEADRLHRSRSRAHVSPVPTGPCPPDPPGPLPHMRVACSAAGRPFLCSTQSMVSLSWSVAHFPVRLCPEFSIKYVPFQQSSPHASSHVGSARFLFLLSILCLFRLLCLFIDQIARFFQQKNLADEKPQACMLHLNNRKFANAFVRR